MTIFYPALLLWWQQEFFNVPLPVLGVAVFLFGAAFGSFLNVVIHRVPREESIVFPNSRCPRCNTAIKPYDNIPILSWLILRGQCRACRAPIAARYPLVEFMTGVLWLIVFLGHAQGAAGLTWKLPFDLIFVTAIVALMFIDAEHMILPDAITKPGMAFALVARVLLPLVMGARAFEDTAWFAAHNTFGTLPPVAVALIGAVLGALVGGGSLWLIGWLWERLRGVEAMGFGDVKMMFAVGAYLGWRLTLANLFLAVLSGSIIGVAMMLKSRDRNMQMLLPFGIFLGAGAILALLFGAQLINWYLSQF